MGSFDLSKFFQNYILTIYVQKLGSSLNYCYSLPQITSCSPLQESSREEILRLYCCCCCHHPHLKLESHNLLGVRQQTFSKTWYGFTFQQELRWV